MTNQPSVGSYGREASGRCARGWDFKLAEALGCSVADLRQAESFARTKRWRRALDKLRNTPSSAPPDARQLDAEV
jgi:hypothetical protein